jgi:hypothetical protein
MPWKTTKTSICRAEGKKIEEADGGIWTPGLLITSQPLNRAKLRRQFPCRNVNAYIKFSWRIRFHFSHGHIGKAEGTYGRHLF